MSKLFKTVILIGVFLLFGYIIWYLFIKPYDYLVAFKAKTSVGTINQSLKSWHASLDNSNNLKQESLGHLTQELELNNTLYMYEWKVNSVDDSTSQVKVFIKDKENSLQNKMSIPFSDTKFESVTKQTVTEFNQRLNAHLKTINVSLAGEGITPETFCAYVTLKGLQKEKASGMMKNYSFLTSILSSNNIKLNGTPFIEVTKWIMENDSITYNFCFPIIKSDSLPEYKNLKYKQYNSVKALKAIYNGNYITSDRAWYALLEEAERGHIQIAKTPIEVFYNNPSFGGDESLWKAEIFMPIKNK